MLTTYDSEKHRSISNLYQICGEQISHKIPQDLQTLLQNAH